MCQASNKFKANMLDYERIEPSLSSRLEFSNTWMNNDKSYLEMLYELYLVPCFWVGKFENIREDLKFVFGEYQMIGVFLQGLILIDIRFGRKIATDF